MSENYSLSKHFRAIACIGALIIPILLFLAVSSVIQAAAASAPVVDLNGELSGPEYSATFTEDNGSEPIVSTTGLTVSDADSLTLAWAKVTLVAAPDGAVESLAADAADTGILVKYKLGSHVLDLSGVKSVAAYQQVLRTVTYLNTSQGPDITDRIVLFEVSDGTEPSIPVTSTVSINAVNDAPLLDNTGTMSLADINENIFTSLGNKIETIIASAGGDRIVDPDPNALEGLAIIEVGSSNGTWQYSLDAGASWLTFENVSNQTAVLLNPAARIRFVPKPQFSGSASITFRAWDQTQGMNGDTGDDVTKNGGTTAFSLATETAAINVIPVNDPPVVDLNGPEPGLNFSAGYLSTGVPIPVADQDAMITDPDSQVLMSATFRLTNRPDGPLELLAANTLSTSITVVPYDPATGELILNGPDTVEAFQQVLRTVNYVNSAIEPTNGDRVVEVTASDGTSTSTTVIATIQINLDNDAPVLNAPIGFVLNSVPEDATNPPGNTIAAMLASAGGDPITDPDEGALEGIAIVGADNSHGVWQYASQPSQEGGPNWQVVDEVSDMAAILLNTDAMIRFVPTANYTGPSGNLMFRAWDQTTGTNGQRNVNVSVNGGSSAFSEQTAVASLTVTPINDAPVINYSVTEPLIYFEDATPLTLFDNSLTITDVDNSTLISAMITLVNRPNGDAEILAVNPTGSGLTLKYENGVLSITGTAAIGVYRQVLSTLTYLNASQDPDAIDRQIQVTVNDGTTSSSPLLLAVEVVPSNDPPVIDLNGAVSGVDFTTSFFIQWKPVRISDPNMVVIDQDDTSLQSATVQITNLLDGVNESLSARVEGTNIKQSYDAGSGTLLLTGIDSVSNYQQVIRSITYNNEVENPSPAMRRIELYAQDGLDKGPVSASFVSIQPTPTAHLFMPIVGRRSEEPNDHCSEAAPVSLNHNESYFTNYRDHDWFYFDLPAASSVVVRLGSFAQGKGQLIVASGRDCDSLKGLGSNGDDQIDKIVDIGQRDAGRYYIWIINDQDDLPVAADLYNLRIDTTP